MRHLSFIDTEELADYMIDHIEDKHYIVAVLFYEQARDLMKDLLAYADVDCESIEISPEYYNGYADEYYVTLTNEYVLFVEPAKSENTYLCTDAKLLLIDGDANSRIIDRNEGSECVEIAFTYFDEDEDDDCCYKCCRDCSDCDCNSDDAFTLTGYIIDKYEDLIGAVLERDSVEYKIYF